MPLALFYLGADAVAETAAPIRFSFMLFGVSWLVIIDAGFAVNPLLNRYPAYALFHFYFETSVLLLVWVNLLLYLGSTLAGLLGGMLRRLYIDGAG